MLLRCVHVQVQSASTASGREAAPSDPAQLPSAPRAVLHRHLPAISRRSSLIHGGGASSSGHWMSLHTMSLKQDHVSMEAQK